MAALLALVASQGACLMQFPALEVDAAPPDAALDAAPIPGERFDWVFELYGIVADPGGHLHALRATGSPSSDRIDFAQVSFDGATAAPEFLTAPRALGAGAFRLDLPEVGPLADATLELQLEERVDLGSAVLHVGTETWDGPVVLVRHREGQPTGDAEPAMPFEFVGVGADGSALATAVEAAGTLGSGAFSLTDGTAAEGQAFVAIPTGRVDSELWGGVTVRSSALLLQGARADTRRFLVAHRLLSVAGAGGILPTLYFGVAQGTPPSQDDLTGTWSLHGIRHEGETWVGESLLLDVPGDDATSGFTLRGPGGEVRSQGDLDRFASGAGALAGLLRLAPKDPAQPTYLCMGTAQPRYLIFWATADGHPLPSLYLGLRQH